MSRRPTRAFTLVEVLIAMTLSGLILASVLSSFVFLARNLARLANRQTLEVKAREAITVLQRDLATAQAVKGGTTASASTVTFQLSAGTVTYTYDSTGARLHRVADFGADRDRYLLQNDYARCTSFAFDFTTLAGGSPASQFSPGNAVPAAIKRVRMSFALETPGTLAPETRATYQVVSARYCLPGAPTVTGN